MQQSTYTEDMKMKLVSTIAVIALSAIALQTTTEARKLWRSNFLRRS